ncbi:alpha/beta hydrolase fold domain-containing protein [Streptomyces sp. QL37]|uniref:alpha/beta hydrolase n=1 Tax=Streptomyces sp. QL37 TaxID=2093747 RepID=UPI000CF23D07|nr:alpha/beta hydrolase [Streptomyces sp. QL37]PPQ61659.1 alpha/beta hydrolase [Streptomyces sp. QL37]
MALSSDPPSVPFSPPAPPDPAALPLPSPSRPAAGVRLLRAAVYRLLEGRRPLELDVWLPEDTGTHVPLVVFVHGGGWHTGLRDNMGPRLHSWQPGPFARLVRAGFAVACLDYRLSGEAHFPAQRDDVAAALRWLNTRAEELGVDASRTVLWGESAGAHLAALAALSARAEGIAPVRGCVCWYVPSDLGALAEDHGGRYDALDPGTYEARLLGAPAGADPERARAASPVAHVTAQAPPFLLLHGTADTAVPTRQSVRLADALREAGVPVELRLVEGAQHLWMGVPDEQVIDCFERSVEFTRARTR